MHATKGSTCQDETLGVFAPGVKEERARHNQDQAWTVASYTCAARAKVAVDMSCVLHLARVVVVPALRSSFVGPTLFDIGRNKK